MLIKDAYSKFQKTGKNYNYYIDIQYRRTA